MLIINILIYFYIFYLGACFGSFLTMASYRIVKKEDLVFKRSYCPICNATLQIRSLFPIFSWLFQKGKCLNCGSKISIRYPLIEIVTATGFLIIHLFVKDQNILHQFYFYTLFLLCMLMCIMDIENYEVPYTLQIIFAIFSIIYMIYSQKYFINSLAGLTYVSIFLGIGYLISKYKNTESIGGADISLVMIIGFFLGFKNINTHMLLSGIFGLIFGLIWIYKTKSKIFPFVPPLIISFLLTFAINNIN